MGDSRKTVLLTGATGNMGREAVKRLSALSDRIQLRLFIRPEEQDHPVVRHVRRRGMASIAWGDLTDPSSVREAVRGAEMVLHVGGLVSPLADNLPPETVTAVNLGGARNIVDAIHAVGNPQQTRLVYIGTVAQTGSRNAPIHWGRTGDPIKISRWDHYAVTKTQAEAIVAGSGITHWASLRQSGIAHYDMWKIFDPIMFHNPLNGVFEWATANDSGRLMAAVCSDDVPEQFWRSFYNIGGGAASRVVNHEFLAKSAPRYRDMLQPHWFATRNFHGQWYADSDRLEELVPFREQGINTYLAEAPRHMPRLVRAVSQHLPGLVSARIRKLAEGPGGSLNWFETNDEDRIRAYFGSRAAWQALPRDWTEFVPAWPSREPRLLAHGYDESRLPAEWRGSDLHDAAVFRGGKCHAGESDDPDTAVEWSCAHGHRFPMSPNLMLRGGHWCPTCMIHPEDYDDIARRNPFFAQVWTEEGDF